MSFKEYWGAQFGNPTGLSGKFSTFIMNRMNQAMYKAVLQEIKNNQEVLEVGFGNGYLLKILLKKTNSKFYGIDISEDMVQNASCRNKKYIKCNRLKLAKAYVHNIPFKNSFEQVYTINTVYFWNDLKSGLQKVYNKLKPNGQFINVCYTKQWLDKLSYTKNYKKYTEKELLQAAESVGFKAELVVIKKNKSFYIRAVK